MFGVKRLASGAFWNVMGKSGQFALQFLISVMVARFLRPEGYGVYANVLTFANLLLLLTALGFDEAANTLAPQVWASSDNSGLSSLVKWLLAWRVAVVGLVCALVYGTASTISVILGTGISASLIRWSLVLCFSMSVTNLLGGFYTGLLEIRFVTITRLVQYGGIAAIVYLLVLSRYGVEYIVAAMGLVTACIAVIYLARAYKYFRMPYGSQPVGLWRVSIPIWATNAVNFILGKQTDILLLGYFALGLAEIGYYDIAFMLVWTLSFLFSSALSGVALSKFSELAGRGEREKLLQAWEISLKYNMLIMLPPLAFLIAYARPIVGFLYTNLFEKSVVSVQVFGALNMLAWALGGASGLTMLYSLKKSQISLGYRVVVGLFNVLVNLILIPRYGGLGALIGTGISRVIVMALENLYVMRVLLRARFPAGFLFKVSCAMVISLGLTRVVFDASQIVDLVSASIIYVFAFSCCLLALAPFDSADLHLVRQLSPQLYRFIVAFPAFKLPLTLRQR